MKVRNWTIYDGHKEFPRIIGPDIPYGENVRVTEKAYAELLETKLKLIKEKLESISDRIRPNSEAAPWVCEEIKNVLKEAG